MQAVLTPQVTPHDHIVGNSDAPVTLVVYGDYECYHSAKLHPVIKTLMAVMKDSLRVVFRNFPMANQHPNAQKAAEATEAASAQGAFWDMHDILYKNRRALSRANLLHYAWQLDLDQARFERELDAGVYAHDVHEDFTSGVRSGVVSAPTVFINGVRCDASYDFETLLSVVESAMQPDIPTLRPQIS